MKNVSTQIAESTYEVLDALSHELRVSKSEIIRRSITEYLYETERRDDEDGK